MARVRLRAWLPKSKGDPHAALGIWYHFLAGLRHLYFDAGHGMDIPTAEKLGWACIIGSVVLTILTIVIV
ncbi:MAG: hypothetical protein EBY40_05395 [Marivivens sp.]|nr:hypothetical protein [Marivivens sp.]